MKFCANLIDISVGIAGEFEVFNRFGVPLISYLVGGFLGCWIGDLWQGSNNGFLLNGALLRGLK